MILVSGFASASMCEFYVHGTEEAIELAKAAQDNEHVASQLQIALNYTIKGKYACNLSKSQMKVADGLIAGIKKKLQEIR